MVDSCSSSAMSAKNQWTILQYIQQREYNDTRFSPRNLMRERLRHASNLFRKDLYSHYGCVNAIEFSNDGEWLVSGGDDRRILVWNVERALHGNGLPSCMKGEHGSNIFCLGFDNNRQKIFSAGNDEQVIVHDLSTGETVDVFLHEEAVYGLSVDPLNNNVFASACEDGRILIWDIREPSSTEPYCLANSTSAFHAVMYNPVEPRLLATANSKEGVSLWDIRSPQKSNIMKYGSGVSSESCMSVRFNNEGTRLLALRRRLPPVLYNIQCSTPACQFDHKNYYNSCTMKSCCFAGENDQYVLSGSDDFNLYMWKIPEEGAKTNWVDEAHVILRGHRSIVNQVRFNHSNFLLASSGVEKIIKLWSPFPIPNSSGGLDTDSPSGDKERKVYSHEEYINLILQSGHVMSHDYSHKSTMEDPRMMAFFDSLVQREIEGWNSDTSLSSITTETWVNGGPENPSESETSTESSSDGELTSNNRSVSPLTIAYGLSVVANRFNVNQISNNSVSENLSSVLIPQDININGSHSSNRISQLIAQKRNQLMQAARAKAVQRLKDQNRSRSRLSVKSTVPYSKRRIRPCISSSDSSDSNEEKSKVENKKQTEQNKTTYNDRRRILRKRRAKILNDDTDSDSDIATPLPVLNTDSTVIDPHSCNGKSTSLSHPSTSQPELVGNNTMNYRSGDLDIENNDSENSSVTLRNENETSVRSADTPDSGIGSNTSENAGLNNNNNNAPPNGTSAWTQFKRIRSRLERACRNYRTYSADSRDQSN